MRLHKYHQKALGLALTFATATIPVDHTDLPPTDEQRLTVLLSMLPPTVATINKERPDFAYEISYSFAILRKDCQPLNTVGIRHAWNVTHWLNQNISEEEWRSSPYTFRMAAYRLTAVQKTTDEKLELLGKLDLTIPNHPRYSRWLDDRKIVFHEALLKDTRLQAERADWQNVVKDEPRLKKYMSDVGQIFIDSFLKNFNIKTPPVKINHSDNSGVWGSHATDNSFISYNFSNDRFTLKNNPDQADLIAAHENFHVVRYHIKLWAKQKQFENDLAFRDAGEKEFFGTDRNLAFMDSAKDGSRYGNSFVERDAFYIADAALPGDKMILLSRTPEWIKNNPEHGNPVENPNQGTYPQACQIK